MTDYPALIPTNLNPGFGAYGSGGPTDTGGGDPANPDAVHFPITLPGGATDLSYDWTPTDYTANTDIDGARLEISVSSLDLSSIPLVWDLTFQNVLADGVTTDGYFRLGGTATITAPGTWTHDLSEADYTGGSGSTEARTFSFAEMVQRAASTYTGTVAHPGVPGQIPHPAAFGTVKRINDGTYTGTIVLSGLGLVFTASAAQFVRQYPRDDGNELSAAPRVYPPPRSSTRRLIGGFN